MSPDAVEIPCVYVPDAFEIAIYSGRQFATPSLLHRRA